MTSITWGDTGRYIPDRYVKIISSDGNSIEDEITGVLPIINSVHHKVHEGCHFSVSGFETLASNGSAVFGIVTPNSTKWLHMLYDVEGTTQTEFYIYENPTFTSGTVKTAMNSNRNSVKTASILIYYNPTITALGDLIYSRSSGVAGATPSKATTESNFQREDELILKQNTKYVFKIISKANDNIISYHGKWYEHTNL